MICIGDKVVVLAEGNVYGRCLEVVAICRRKDMVGVRWGDPTKGDYPTWFLSREVRMADPGER
jgi:hypothetical protein